MCLSPLKTSRVQQTPPQLLQRMTSTLLDSGDGDMDGVMEGVMEDGVDMGILTMDAVTILGLTGDEDARRGIQRFDAVET